MTIQKAYDVVDYGKRSEDFKYCCAARLFKFTSDFAKLKEVHRLC